MSDVLTFNDQLDLLGINNTGLLTSLTGSPVIDYDTGRVTAGSLSLTAAGLIPAVTFTAAQLVLTSTTTNGVTTYTLAGTNGLTSVTVTYVGQLPSSFTMATVYVAGVAAASATNETILSSAVVCFAQGTFIRTPRGDVTIERLNVGDLVLTAAGEARAVKWLSHRNVECHRHLDPRDAMPVRIAADAFGAGLPMRDLVVSPGHALCVSVVEEVLIPASALINGATIAQMDVDTVTYWHVELDSHDIILANGLPTESYIDVGNRVFFETGRGAIDPDRDAATLADYCRPFVADGPIVHAVRQRLRGNALRLGWSFESISATTQWPHMTLAKAA